MKTWWPTEGIARMVGGWFGEVVRAFEPLSAPQEQAGRNGLSAATSPF